MHLHHRNSLLILDLPAQIFELVDAEHERTYVRTRRLIPDLVEAFRSHDAVLAHEVADRVLGLEADAPNAIVVAPLPDLVDAVVELADLLRMRAALHELHDQGCDLDLVLIERLVDLVVHGLLGPAQAKALDRTHDDPRGPREHHQDEQRPSPADSVIRSAHVRYLRVAPQGCVKEQAPRFRPGAQLTGRLSAARAPCLKPKE